jgi:hypothetical protein
MDMHTISSGKIWRVVATGIILWASFLFFTGCSVPNIPPVIDSLQSQPDEVRVSGSCEVECSAADADDDVLSYDWSATGGTLSGEGATVTWTAPDTPGAYSVSVIVSDGNDGQATMQLHINVKANQLPVIDSLTAEPSAVGQGLNGTFMCRAHDPDGDTLSYKWKASAGIISGQGDEAIWTAPDIPGNYTVMVEVTDSTGGKAILSTTIDVLRNNGPLIESLKADPSYVVAGRTSTIECIAYDPDDDELYYKWEASAGDVPGEGPVIEWTAPDNCSTCTITVTVSDGRGGEASDKVKVWVRASGG